MFDRHEESAMSTPAGRDDHFYIIPKALWASEPNSASSPYSEPVKMLEQFADALNDRKFRLFAVVCCRRVLSVVSDERVRTALEVAARFADHAATREELARAHDAVARLVNGLPPLDAKWHDLPVPEQDALERRRNAYWAILGSTEDRASKAAEDTPIAAASASAWEYRLSCGPSILGAARDKAADMGYDSEQRWQIEILRDLLERPAGISDERAQTISREVRAFADMIYEQESFARMKELAAVIEESGGCPQSIVEHCKSPGPHVRGCWALDWILGRD